MAHNIAIDSLPDLCSVLTTLLKMEDAKGFSEAEWYDLSIKLKKHLSPSVSDQVDHEVWHYLDDLDIRLKDAKYGEAQKSKVQVFLEKNSR